MNVKPLLIIGLLLKNETDPFPKYTYTIYKFAQKNWWYIRQWITIYYENFDGMFDNLMLHWYIHTI